MAFCALSVKNAKGMEIKMKKRTVAALLMVSLSMIAQNFISVPVVHASQKEDAFNAYYQLIEELHKADSNPLSEVYDEFELVYIDDDAVPELLAVDVPVDEYDNNGTYQYALYTYYGGEAVKLGDFSSGVASAGGYRGSTMYIKKSGKVYETYISSGTGDGSDIVYKMKNGNLVKKAKGDYHLATDTQEWKGKTVSKKAYNKKLKKAFNTNKGINLEEIKTKSYQSMRQELQKG